MPDPVAVLRHVQETGLPLVIDENHSTQRAAPAGGPSPALARISVDALSVDANGAIWGEPDWTPYGLERTAQGAYLGLSPALLISNGEIKGLASAGLVNDPNMDLPVALNARQLEALQTMDPEIAALLGLPEDATPDQVKAAVKALQAPAPAPAPTDPALNSAQAQAPAAAPVEQPEPAWLVALNARLDTLEGNLKNKAQGAHEVAVNSAIERVISAGKLPPTPEARQFAKAQCESPEGLKAFCDYYEQAPAMVPDVALNSAAPAGKPKASERQEKIAKAMGLSIEEYLAD